MSVEVPLRCPAEDRVIGTVIGEPGALIDSAAIYRGYEPAEGYALNDQAVKDGAQLLCPRCRNPVVFADGEGIYVVPGAIRFGEEKGADET